MSQVRIPPVLRPSAGGQKLLDVAGRHGAARSWAASSPRTRTCGPRLLDDDGAINRFVNVFVNETDVRHLQALDTPVGDRDTLVLLPAMAGG